MQFCNKIIIKTIKAMLLSMVLISLLNAQESSSFPEGDDTSWRFIILSDWHAGERYVLGDRRKNFKNAHNEIISTLKWMKQDIGGELVLLPGDSNVGHWDTPKFINKFNAELTAKQSILQAGKLCYEGMIRAFQEGGYGHLLMAVGDHELGDDPWPVKKDVSRYQPQFRETFAKAFNFSSDGHTFKYNRKIGSADSRPLGTKYKDTSYAYKHKNVLFITLDVFHQIDYKTKIGKHGTVTGTVVGPHLQWLESVLSEAKKDANIKHIFVQSHLPVIYPVRKINSSGMLLDEGMKSALWRLLRKYGVDIYFAGEVHANTVTKDSDSDLLQVVTRGNAFSNFQTVDVNDDEIDITLYRHYGNNPSDENYQIKGKLSIDKSNATTSIQATGELSLFNPKSRLLHFTFEEDFVETDRPINGLLNGLLNKKKRRHNHMKNSYIVDGKLTHRTFANLGSFGPQYDALHYNVKIVPGKNGNAGLFTEESRMAVFAMGPLQGGRAVAYELSFKTQSNQNQILINTATIWGNKPKGFLNLYLDDGYAAVATSDKHILNVKSKKLNDGQWHRLKVTMPYDYCKLSELIIEVDGNKMKTTLGRDDATLNFKQSMRFTVGGKGYSSKALKNIPINNFSGLIDDISLWAL